MINLFLYKSLKRGLLDRKFSIKVKDLLFFLMANFRVFPGGPVVKNPPTVQNLSGSIPGPGI